MDEQESSGADSRPEEQTSEFEEEGDKDMTDEHSVETEGVGGENGEMAVTDMARNVTTEDVGSENDSVSSFST